MKRKTQFILVIVALAVVVSFVASMRRLRAQDQSALTMDDVMTGRELKDTGVGQLSPQQRAALDAWLIRYTVRVAKAANAANAKTTASAPTYAPHSSSCSPAIESSIDGDFEGWSGETIFKLANGQIWQQASYDYTYSYSYAPEVTIYETSGGCRMSVKDETDTVLVKRIK